ncbi:RNA-binding protein 40-like [Limulus polyphemus]|uniref:RNA-binding region-containing protein 3 n=1 Tax=Limulus polyphemus TaxID=6850 RepID=A0ABM1BU94_LIMPO|nr:RNA-binding protein 40-like [Limulus polyphemus]
MKMTGEMDSSTLVVRHLPSELSIKEKEEMLKYFGASHVRVMSETGRMKHTAFATFSSPQHAEQALKRLHQLNVLERRLVVEFAKPQQKKYFPHEGDFSRTELMEQKVLPAKEMPEREEIQSRMAKFKLQLHSVAPKLGLDYLPSPLLKYRYPPPTPTILSNICHALSAVPKFYTQVLHLMNKMNLPAPFGPLTPTPPVMPDVQPSVNPVGKDMLEEEEMDVTTSEEESEIESETEQDKKEKLQPLKRPTRRVKRKFKKPKLQQLQAPSTTVTVRTDPTEVFETPVGFTENQATKKIQLNIKPTEVEVLNNKDIVSETKDSVCVQEGGFGMLIPQQDVVHDTKEDDEDQNLWVGSKFVSSDELQKNRITKEEKRSLSVFRNYQAGEPSSRLYIKNLAKQVVEKDLHRIYGRYIDRDSEVEKNMYDVRVMKEGRMKGQAFVTLASEKEASKAVAETNGFLLYGKPLVVQFARSAKPKGKQTETKKK